MVACPSCGSENADDGEVLLGVRSGARGRVGARARGAQGRHVSSSSTSSARRPAPSGSIPRTSARFCAPTTSGCGDELESYGGTVEKFIGDAVVARLRRAVAHEDDPERAVRAALAVRDAIADLNEDDPSLELHVRVARQHGRGARLARRAPGAGRGMVAGDVINTAARLQSAAPVDGILVGEQTYRATERRDRVPRGRAVEAKGKSEPVPVWEARRGALAASASTSAARRRDARRARRASSTCSSTRSRASGASARTQLVTLVGVPGIGKSRLVYELFGASSSTTPSSSLAPGTLPALRRGRHVLGARRDGRRRRPGSSSRDAADAAEAEARRAVADCSPTSASAAGSSATCGRSWGSAASEPGGDAPRRGVRRLAPLLRGASPKRGPLVLVFEDLHWADDGLLDFVDNLVDWVSGVPLLVLCTARPELLERRPGLGRREAQRDDGLARAALRRGDGASAPRRCSTGRCSTPRRSRRSSQRAGGNPLYAEEYVRMLDDRGERRTAASGDDSGHRRGPARPASRDARRRCSRHAAVLGKVFWIGRARRARRASILGARAMRFARSSGKSSSAGSGARPSPARAQYAFATRSCGTSRTGRCRVPRARTRHRRAAEWIESLPTTAPRTARRCSRTTTWPRSSYARSAGDDVDGPRRPRGRGAAGGGRPCAARSTPTPPPRATTLWRSSSASPTPRGLLAYGTALWHQRA